MKKIISKFAFAIIAISSVFLFSFKVAENENLRREKNIDLTFTSTGGCSVHIKGKVTYSLFPFEVSGFHGSIDLSGTCSGSYTFARGGVPAPAAAIISMGADSHIDHITWSTDAGAIKVLESTEIEHSIKTSFENIDNIGMTP